MNPTTLEELPIELLFRILSFLHVEELGRLRSLNRYWKFTIIEDDVFWKKKLKEYFPFFTPTSTTLGSDIGSESTAQRREGVERDDEKVR